MAFVWYFPIVIPCLLERVVTCVNVYTKPEVLVMKENEDVLKKKKMFSWRHKFDFLYTSCMYFIRFLF